MSDLDAMLMTFCQRPQAFKFKEQAVCSSVRGVIKACMCAVIGQHNNSQVTHGQGLTNSLRTTLNTIRTCCGRRTHVCAILGNKACRIRTLGGAPCHEPSIGRLGWGAGKYLGGRTGATLPQ